MNAEDLESVSLACKLLRTIALDPALFKETSKEVNITDMAHCPTSLGFSRFTSGLHLSISKYHRRIKEDADEDEGSADLRMQNSGLELQMHPCWNEVGEVLTGLDFFDLRLQNLDACFTLVHKASHLETIEFMGTTLQDSHLITIAENCQVLKSFVTDSGSAARLTDVGLKALSEKCHQLVEFKLEDGYGGENSIMDVDANDGITEDGIRALITANPGLTSLSFYNLANLSDEWIRVIARGCSKLEAIDIFPETDHNTISDSAIEELIKNCGYLENLALEADITDETLEHLRKHCPNMKTLCLQNCWDVTIEGLRSFVKQGTEPLKLWWGDFSDEVKTLKKEFPRLILLQDPEWWV